MVKPTISLLVICFVVALCLALVNNLTRDTIKQRAEKDAEEQRMQVLKEAKSFKELDDWKDMDGSGLIREAYAAYDGETLVGYVFGAYPKGYGGEIKVTVGIGNDSKISGVVIGDNKETPGLGSKAADIKFTGQYTDKDIQKPFKVVKVPPEDDNDIQAISGATISSKAVTNAVQASAELVSKLLQDGGDVK
jgi:electron transport complex protein RnfG